MSVEAFPLQWPEGWPRTPYSKRGPSRFGKNLGFGEIRKLQNELRLMEHALTVEHLLNWIHLEKINGPLLFQDKASPADANPTDQPSISDTRHITRPSRVAEFAHIENNSGANGL
jgi:hypothetical protein